MLIFHLRKRKKKLRFIIILYVKTDDHDNPKTVIIDLMSAIFAVSSKLVLRFGSDSFLTYLPIADDLKSGNNVLVRSTLNIPYVVELSTYTDKLSTDGRVYIHGVYIYNYKKPVVQLVEIHFL